MASAFPIQILLVEDNPGDATLVREALRTGGLDKRIHHVTDGLEAMRFLRREPPYGDAVRPDIVLLDLNLPRMDGRQVLRTMKEDPNLAQIPVVTLTTSGADSDIQQCYQFGANAYMRKPVDFDQFMDSMEAFVRFWVSTATLPLR